MLDMNATHARYGFAAAITAWANAATKSLAHRSAAEIAKHDRGAVIARRRMDDLETRMAIMRAEVAAYDARRARERAGL